jgi:hypothetical protein
LDNANRMKGAVAHRNNNANHTVTNGVDRHEMPWRKEVGNG